jgi:colanic acid biosynthesis glycosyl transferase WcaI
MNGIIFINRFFYPDHSATSQILSDLAFHLAARGKVVRVIASRQCYDDPHADLIREERIAGVEVHRVSTTQFGRSTLPGRAIDYASFYLAAARAMDALVGRGDIVVVKTDPPLFSVVATRIARRRGAVLVNWLQDIYPEIAGQLGVAVAKGPIGLALAYARDASLRAARANVVLGERMGEWLASRKIDPDAIRVIPNWVDDENISAVRHADNPLRQQWGLEGKFVVGYSGNLGRAHEFDTLLAAAERLRGRPDIIFLFIGGGHHVSELERLAGQRGLLRNFVFQPYQDRAQLKFSLSVADVHWISLRVELEGLIVPSKIYGIMAAGRPMLAVTSADG